MANMVRVCLVRSRTDTHSYRQTATVELPCLARVEAKVLIL